MKTLDRMPFKARKAVFEKLEEIADVSALSPEERDKYENSLRVYRDHLAVMDAAEQKGIEKGEQKAELRIACDMKSRGMDVTLISELTGLSIDVITNL